MLQEILSSLNNALVQNFWIAGFAALAWGILSIVLSPCHLASIPLLIGFITSQEVASRRRVFLLSLLFAVGILITIAGIGLITAMLGKLMGDVGMTGNIIMAAIFVVIGLYLMEIISLPWNGFQFSTNRNSGLLTALILGLLFGVGLGPCTFAFMAPILGVVFQTAATNILSAIILLSAFAIGHCTIIVVAGVLANRIGEYLNWTEKSKVTFYIKRICGFLVILGGLYMVWSMF